MTGRNFPLFPAARRTVPGRRGAAVALAAVLTLSLSACNDDDPEKSGNTPNTASPAEPSETSVPTDAPEVEPAPVSGAVGVYLVGTTPSGPRLFREFHKAEGDRATAAATLVDGGDVLDPDYRTLWPGQTVSKVTQADAEGITVELNGDAFTEAPDGMTAAEAQLAIQQMVYTLQGVVGERVPVTFTRPGGETTLFGVDVSKPVSEAVWNDVLAHVNVTTPADAQRVSGTTLKASGVASAFEATVNWSIVSGSGDAAEVVLSGFATTDGWMEKLYPWETEIDISSLEPGKYTFIARDFDLGEGEEGNAPTEDSKTFSVS